MPYTSIPDIKRQIGKPVTKDLVDLIHYNFEDLNTRVSAISISAGSAVLKNELLKPPVDDLPVGTLVYCSLTSAQLPNDGGEWVLANGANVAGSDWAILTGRTVLPDVRGRFLRAKDNAAGNAADLALDLYTADTVASHSHAMGHGHSSSSGSAGGHDHWVVSSENSSFADALTASNYFSRQVTDSSSGPNYTAQGAGTPADRGLSSFDGAHTHSISVADFSGSTSATGGTETAPKFVTENAFIKINRAYIRVETRQLAIRVAQQTIINNILVTPVSQGTSGNLIIDIKKGASPITATQSIFQSGHLPTLAWNGAVGVTGLTDSAQNTVAAGQFIVVSITSTQAKLKEFHLFISGDY